MYCTATLSALFLGFALYQIFWGIRDLRLAARLRRGDATSIGEATVGASLIVRAEALPAEGVGSLVDGASRAWVRGRLARVRREMKANPLLLEHEPAPLTVRDDSATAQVSVRRAHDATPHNTFLDLSLEELPEPLAEALKAAGADDRDDLAPPGSTQLWYEESSVAPGERVYVFGRVTRAAGSEPGGAYRDHPTPARIEDAVVSPETPAGLALPYRNRGLMLLLGGLVLGGLGAAMLSVAVRAAI